MRKGFGELLKDVEREVAVAKQANANGTWPTTMVFPPSLLDVALEIIANGAVLRAHVAQLTARVEELEAKERNPR